MKISNLWNPYIYYINREVVCELIRMFWCIDIDLQIRTLRVGSNTGRGTHGNRNGPEAVGEASARRVLLGSGTRGTAMDKLRHTKLQNGHSRSVWSDNGRPAMGYSHGVAVRDYG